MITIDELNLYIELLQSYYGEDYIDGPHHLSEMIGLEFDLYISPEDILRIINTTVDTEDIKLNYKTCGIFY